MKTTNLFHVALFVVFRWSAHNQAKKLWRRIGPFGNFIRDNSGKEECLSYHDVSLFCRISRLDDIQPDQE